MNGVPSDIQLLSLVSCRNAVLYLQMQALHSDLRTPSYCMIRVVIGTAFKPNASLYSVFLRDDL